MEHLSHVINMLRGMLSPEHLPSPGDRAGLGLIFVFGLLTSLHCIAMCGGIVISSSSKDKKISSSAAYNTGRVISYTVVGAAAGGLGHAVSLPGLWKGIIPFIGGLMMILFAIKQFNLFPPLRRLSIKKPSVIALKIFRGQYRNTLVIGLLSGLMPCGPLQMVQLYALGTKSIYIGGVSAFLFALGTIPVLFGLGLINSVLNVRFSRVFTNMSTAIVLVLGFAMLGRGLALAGINVPAFQISDYNRDKITSMAAEVSNTQKVQIINSELKAHEYPHIVVKMNIPVKWIIHAEKNSLNNCNSTMVIPDLHLQKKLSVGDNIIEFTPEESGDILYSCWMGMIKSKITVTN